MQSGHRLHRPLHGELGLAIKGRGSDVFRAGVYLIRQLERHGFGASDLHDDVREQSLRRLQPGSTPGDLPRSTLLGMIDCKLK